MFGSTTKTARRSAETRRPTSPRPSQNQRQPRPVPASRGAPVRTGGPGLWAFGLGARENRPCLSTSRHWRHRPDGEFPADGCAGVGLHKIGVRCWGPGRTGGTRASGPRLWTTFKGGLGATGGVAALKPAGFPGRRSRLVPRRDRRTRRRTGKKWKSCTERNCSPQGGAVGSGGGKVN